MMRVPPGAKSPESRAFLGKSPTITKYPIWININTKLKAKKLSINIIFFGVSFWYPTQKSETIFYKFPTESYFLSIVEIVANASSFFFLSDFLGPCD